MFLEKESQSKKLSKAWSEPDTSDDDNSYPTKSPIRSSPKKRKLVPKFNRQLEKEFIELPKSPTTPMCSNNKLYFMGYILFEIKLLFSLL